MTVKSDSQESLNCFLVGGAVRNQLLGLPVVDRDWVVVGSTPSRMKALGYQPVGKDFPVFLHPVTKEEYALARTERKVSVGYHGFDFNASPEISLEEDLRRRDLTINAIAQNAQGEIIDPWNGVADINQRIIRHVSEAFAEDPLRILRVARFSALLSPLGFTIAPETIELMQQLSNSEELSTLAPERIYAEIDRAMATKAPTQFFDTLRRCGALQHLLPEVDQLFGVPQPAQYHPEIDSGVHTMMVLEQTCLLCSETSVRFASLCHDLGKATTPVDILPSHHGHEERGADITSTLCERLRAPKHVRELSVLTARYHGHCHNAFKLRTGSVLKLLLAVDALRRPERFEHFLLICEADSRGRLGFEDRPYPQANYLRGAQKALQQIDYAGIARHEQAQLIREKIYREQLQVLASYKAAYKQA